MSSSINKVILLGRLGADPEIRISKQDKKIAKLSLATSESWNDKSTNEKKEKTEWHRVVIFSPGLAEVAEKYLKKGSLVYIEGQISYGKYTDQSGAEKYTTDIVLQGFNSTLRMLDNKSDGSNEIRSPSVDNSVSNKKVSEDFDDFDTDDVVPF